MLCIICHEKIGDFSSHFSEHAGVTAEEITGYFTKLCKPYQVEIGEVTATDLKTIRFSPENALILMAYGRELYNISWQLCCKWLAEHEKSHIRLRELYSPPISNPGVISCVEDYYIENFMMSSEFPEFPEFREICRISAEMSLKIRAIAPMPDAALLNIEINARHFLSLATWLALKVLDVSQLELRNFELAFVIRAAEIMREIERVEQLRNGIMRINSLHQTFFRFYRYLEDLHP
jgi:hypothetical protein